MAILVAAISQDRGKGQDKYWGENKTIQITIYLLRYRLSYVFYTGGKEGRGGVEV